MITRDFNDHNTDRQTCINNWENAITTENVKISLLFSSGFPDEKGVDVAPASATHFALYENRRARLTIPYPSNCYDNWTMTNYTDVLGKLLD